MKDSADRGLRFVICFHACSYGQLFFACSRAHIDARLLVVRRVPVACLSSSRRPRARLWLSCCLDHLPALFFSTPSPRDFFFFFLSRCLLLAIHLLPPPAASPSGAVVVVYYCPSFPILPAKMALRCLTYYFGVHNIPVDFILCKKARLLVKSSDVEMTASMRT